MRLAAKISMALASIFNFLMPVSMVVDPNCDYYQDVIMGREYYIYNQQYPNYYPASTACNWVARSAPGTRIVISCEIIELPSSKGCSDDRLSFSLSGNEAFTDSKNYCGEGTLSLVSDGNALAVGLFTASNSKGGRFICALTAILDTSDNPTTTQPPPTCDCGYHQTPRIVGGQETGINEFPEMAGLVDVQKRIIYCGGTIISNRFVLTAAHCIFNRNIDGVGVLVGDHDINRGNDTQAAALYRISAYETHPYFDMDSLANDIALIQTERVISFSIKVGPVCLPFRYTNLDFSGQVVTALGWGQLFFSGPMASALQKVDLNIVPNDACQKQHQDPVTETQICTYAENKDACQSDSGGPLLWKDTSTNRLHLIGIISLGVGCATTRPGVNTRVTSFISWIVSRTTEATYCIK